MADRQAVTERTNASTTGLLGVRTGAWDPDLLGLVGLEPARLGELVDPAPWSASTTGSRS